MLAMSVTARWIAGTPSASSMDGSRHGRGRAVDQLGAASARSEYGSNESMLRVCDRLVQRSERQEVGDACPQRPMSIHLRSCGRWPGGEPYGPDGCEGGWDGMRVIWLAQPRSSCRVTLRAVHVRSSPTCSASSQRMTRERTASSNRAEALANSCPLMGLTFLKYLPSSLSVWGSSPTMGTPSLDRRHRGGRGRACPRRSGCR